VLLSSDGKYMPCSHHTWFITEKLKNYVSTTYEMDELRTKNIDSRIAFLNVHDDRDFGKFFRHTARHHKYRAEISKKYFLNCIN
jgi:hypothetical protein